MTQKGGDRGAAHSQSQSGLRTEKGSSAPRNKKRTNPAMMPCARNLGINLLEGMVPAHFWSDAAIVSRQACDQAILLVQAFYACILELGDGTGCHARDLEPARIRWLARIRVDARKDVRAVASQAFVVLCQQVGFVSPSLQRCNHPFGHGQMDVDFARTMWADGPGVAVRTVVAREHAHAPVYRHRSPGRVRGPLG